MARIGFFQTLLDDNMSWWEAQAINEAHDQADAALIAAQGAGEAMAVLQRRLVEQRRELAMLKAAVGVLCQVLRDTKVVDAKLLDYRLEAALEEINDDATGSTKPAPQLTSCTRCHAHVPVTNTVVTETGQVCDRCFAQR